MTANKKSSLAWRPFLLGILISFGGASGTELGDACNTV